jgi:hypothetical protein
VGIFGKRQAPLPMTSDGYMPPPEATAHGWKCPNPECSTGGEGAPRRWPFPCPSCGTATDPDFDEPWANEAKGPWLKGQVEQAEAEAASGGWKGGVPFWKSELESWTYQEAQSTGSREAAHAAQIRLHELIARARVDDPSFFGGMARGKVVLSAISANDPESGAFELRDWLAAVPTGNVDDNNDERTNVRQVIMCITRFAEAFPNFETTGEFVSTCGVLVSEASSALSNDMIAEYRAIAR